MEKLVILPEVDYTQKIIQRLSKIPKKEVICYVSLNKTYNSLIGKLNDAKINSSNMFFIDTISPTIFKKLSNKNCIYVDSLDLNNFATIILDTIRVNKITTVVFDSISSMLVYKTDKEVIDFFDYLAPFLEELNVDLEILCLKEDYDTAPVKQLKMRVDKIDKIGIKNG